MKTRISSSSIRAVGRSQLGMAMAEFMFYLALAAVVLLAAVGLYQYNKSSISASDTSDKVMILVQEVQKNWRSAGSFTTVSAAEVNKLSIIRAPLRYNGTNMEDAWGNVMALNGAATTFALTIGGTAQPMGQENCANLVGRLEAFASVIRIGADATATAGAATGGSLYKNGTTVTQSGLTDGCAAENAVIAAQFRF